MQFLKTMFLRLVRQQYATVEIVEPPPAVAPKVVQIDTRIQSIKRLAALRLCCKPISDDMSAGLSDRTMDWLETLNLDMLLLVTSSPYSKLSEHLAGRKTVRGLLAADPASVAAYKQAMRQKVSLSDIEGRRGGGGPKRSSAGPKR